MSARKKTKKTRVVAEEGEESKVRDSQAEDSAVEGSALEDATVAAAQPAEPAEELSVEEQLEQALEELARQRDLHLRALAEQENMARRQERERGDRARYAVEPLARDLLEVVDQLEMAVEHAGAGAENLVQGVSLVLNGLGSVLERHGVERMEAKGEAFDPAQHEAISIVEATGDSEEKPRPDSVDRVVRAGYRFKDRLLRPARVVVARAPAADSSSEPEKGKKGDES
jgi:molecular chaperone GrpE